MQVELIRRCGPILRFLADLNSLKDSHLRALWFVIVLVGETRFLDGVVVVAIK